MFRNLLWICSIIMMVVLNGANHQNDFDKDTKLAEELTEENSNEHESNADEGGYTKLTKINISLTQSVQENSYYCVPACVQMVLNLHGIQISQQEIAKEMNTKPSSGTEYVDLARVLNTYIFHNGYVQLNEPGYRIQTLVRNSTDPQIAADLEKRVRTDISTKDPIFVAVDVHALYRELPSANHMILISGYAVYNDTDQIAYYYIMDPLYTVQDPVYGGLKTVTKEELVHAIITNEEPAYIW